MEPVWVADTLAPFSVMADFKTYGFVAAVKKPFYTDEIVGAVEKAAF